jgi:hypothetical protein
MRLTEDAGGGGDARETKRGSSGPLYPTEFAVDVRAAGKTPAVNSIAWRRCASRGKGEQREGIQGYLWSVSWSH